jgi:O-antigen/teichoic acid export membrane protein
MTSPLTMGRAGRHTLVYGVGILVSRAVSFVMLPFYTHYLTPANYGVMQLVEMTLDIVAILAGTKIATGIFRYYYKAESEADKRAVLSTAMILLGVSFGVFAAATAVVAPALSRLVFGSPEHATLIRLAAGSLGVSSLVVAPLALLRLQERSVRFTWITSAKLLLQVTLNVIFLAVFGLGVKGVFIGTLIANSVLGLALAAPFIARVGLRYSERTARDLLRYGLPLVATNIATFVVAYGDRYFLRRSGDDTVVGLYALAYQFGFILSMVGYGPFATMWEPVRFELASRADRDHLYARAFLYMNLLLWTAALGIGLFVGDFIQVMAAPAYWSASQLVPIILLAYVLQSWSGFQELGVLVKERSEFVTLANWLAAAAALLFYVLLIPRYLGLGAAIATLLAFGVRSAVTHVASQRLWPIRYEWPPVWRLIGVATVVYAAGRLVPTASLAGSIVIHSLLFGVYLVLLWFTGVIPAEGRERVRRLIRQPRTAAPVDSPSAVPWEGTDSRGNWMWLAAPASWDRVLEVGAESASLAPALADHFAVVHRLDPERVGRGAAQPAGRLGVRRGSTVSGSVRSSPFRDGSFDCIVYHPEPPDPNRGSPATSRSRRDALRECLRMLRPGGCLCVTSPNPCEVETLWSRLRAGVARQGALSARGLRRCGFARVCAYYVDPSSDWPESVTPTTRRASLVSEQVTGEPGVRGLVRRVVGAAGLHRLIHSSMMFLAYK